MHDIIKGKQNWTFEIELLIDIAKGDKVKIPYLKGKKEKMKERRRINNFI